MPESQTQPPIPLLRFHAMESAFAWRDGHAVSVRRFLTDALSLAEQMPDRPYVLNLCADRYRFVVGFAAAMLRGQISLLPPNHTPYLTERLKQRYAGLYCLADGENISGSLQTLSYPDFSGVGLLSVPMPEIPATQIAAIVFTSGSTGDPMPNEKTWGNLSYSVTAEAGRLGILNRGDLTVLGTVPPQHMYGLESTALIAMQCGVVMHPAKPFFPADINAALNAIRGAKALVTTPVHLRALVTSKLGLPKLDLVVCATAPLSRELAMQAEELFAAPLHEVYGLTEAGQIAGRRTTLTDEWRTSDGVVLHQEDETTYASGGHVAGKLALNDLIELRSATTFLLHGRTSDLINIAGKRTSLASLNHHLNAIEGVQDGVFIMPEEKGDDTARLTAFVVAPNLDTGEILKALRQRIDPVFLPRPLHKVDALPRNSTGKLPHASLDLLLRQTKKS